MPGADPEELETEQHVSHFQKTFEPRSGTSRESWRAGAMLVAVLSGLVFSDEARALSLRGCEDKLVIRPELGAVRVPTNTEVQLFKIELHRPISASQVELFDAGGKPVALRLVADSPAVLRLKPEMALAPMAKYRIVVKAPADVEEGKGWSKAAPAWLGGEQSFERWFTTGVERDTDPPVLKDTAIEFFRADSFERLKGRGWRSATFRIRAEDEQDPAPMALAFVGRSADALGDVALVQSSNDYLGTNTYSNCTGWAFDDEPTFAAPAALDRAGNLVVGDAVERRDAFWDGSRVITFLLLVVPIGVVVAGLRSRRAHRQRRA